MKSYILLFSLFILVGCTALEPSVIKTEGNTFSSSKYPSVSIEFANDLRYIGMDNSKGKWSVALYVLKVTGYLYAKVINPNYIEKLARVTLFEVHAGRDMSPNMRIFSARNSLRQSTFNFGETKYNLCISAQENVNQQTDDYLHDKGFTLPRCNMWMQLWRVSGDYILDISYFEDISNFDEFGIGSCADWKDKNKLNEKQQGYIQEFEKRALSSIKISNK